MLVGILKYFPCFDKYFEDVINDEGFDFDQLKENAFSFISKNNPLNAFVESIESSVDKLGEVNDKLLKDLLNNITEQLSSLYKEDTEEGFEDIKYFLTLKNIDPEEILFYLNVIKDNDIDNTYIEYSRKKIPEIELIVNSIVKKDLIDENFNLQVEFFDKINDSINKDTDLFKTSFDEVYTKSSDYITTKLEDHLETEDLSLIKVMLENHRILRNNDFIDLKDDLLIRIPISTTKIFESYKSQVNELLGEETNIISHLTFSLMLRIRKLMGDGLISDLIKNYKNELFDIMDGSDAEEKEDDQKGDNKSTTTGNIKKTDETLPNPVVESDSKLKKDEYKSMKKAELKSMKTLLKIDIKELKGEVVKTLGSGEVLIRDKRKIGIEVAGNPSKLHFETENV